MANILHYARMMMTGAKSPVPERKRKILSEAEKEIDTLEGQKTERTKQIEKATRFPSDITRKQRETARKARLLLRGK